MLTKNVYSKPIISINKNNQKVTNIDKKSSLNNLHNFSIKQSLIQNNTQREFKKILKIKYI